MSTVVIIIIVLIVIVFAFVGIAPCMLASRISQWEEQHPWELRK